MELPDAKKVKAATLRSLKDGTPEQAVAAFQRHMNRLEATAGYLVNVLDDMAGEDRCCKQAELALRMRKLELELTQIHCEASLIGFEAAEIPMPRAGDR